MPIDDFPGDHQGTSGAKFILIQVPDFNSATGTQVPMQSYLRLGANDPAVTPGRPPETIASPNVDPWGEDLAALVTDFADDSRQREAPVGQTATPPAVGETRPAGSSTVPNDGLAEMREHESALLHTKGGWRDHSDGNRITTTRGDKVEVIRGNYRMLVLGRRDPWRARHADPDLQNAVSWDISGGLFDGSDPGETSQQPALATEYVWQANSDGRWGWTSRTKIGSYDTSTSSGNGKTISYTWVDEIWSYTGSPEPDPQNDPGQNVAGNPDAFASGTGSAPRPVKKMTSKQWGETILQEQHATRTANSPVSPSLTSITTSDGDMTSTTNASSDFHEKVEIGGTHSYHSAASVLAESTATNAHNVFETSDWLSDETFCSTMQFSLSVMPLSLSVQVAAIIAEVKTLIHADVHLGVHADFHLGLHFDAHVGAHTQFKTVVVKGVSVTQMSLANDDTKVTAIGNWMTGLLNIT